MELLLLGLLAFLVPRCAIEVNASLRMMQQNGDRRMLPRAWTLRLHRNNHTARAPAWDTSSAISWLIFLFYSSMASGDEELANKIRHRGSPQPQTHIYQRRGSIL